MTIIQEMRYIEKVELIKSGNLTEAQAKILSDDADWAVRSTLAGAGYELEKLIYDSNPNVRMNVAEYGYGLDILVNDTDWIVRAAVAEHGYGLDILVNDKDLFVRMEVAKNAYGLEQLSEDTNSSVSSLAKELTGSKMILVEKIFGTYNGALRLYVFEDKYLIISGCFKADDLLTWASKCERRISKEVADSYYKKIHDILVEEWEKSAPK